MGEQRARDPGVGGRRAQPAGDDEDAHKIDGTYQRGSVGLRLREGGRRVAVLEERPERVVPVHCKAKRSGVSPCRFTLGPAVAQSERSAQRCVLLTLSEIQ